MRPIARHETARGQRSIFREIVLTEAVFCRGCSRLITQEKSVQRGYGPQCWINHLEKMIRNESEDQ